MFSTARLGSLASYGAPADEPDCHRYEQHRQHEQPAALDPLERPEAARRLVGNVTNSVYPCWARYCTVMMDCGIPAPFPPADPGARSRNWLTTDWLTGRPPLVHCSLTIHAELRTFNPLVTRGVR
jgi:hypothetical protein